MNGLALLEDSSGIWWVMAGEQQESSEKAASKAGGMVSCGEILDIQKVGIKVG